MPDTLRLIIFILVAIGAIASLYKEFKKPEKSTPSIIFNILILIGVSVIIKDVLGRLT
ncbi:hypothetical protein [Bacillus cereus]|uniref:hypothetical protein n=1 Tax=Bacillus cereus TaxID=1396 RepID=UPI0018F73BBD|nr:hypothetical protein [Bacillus cereus]MBJ7987796.1 hypothetical protein [Bacillus cereus]